jgi:dihydrofolate reductase
MDISLMAAYDENRVIGVNNDIPWKIPSDLKNFKKFTSGHTVIMGRKTYDSIPDRFKPLPKRRNIVLTTNNEWKADGVEVAHNVQEAITICGKDEKVFVIGGEEVYRSFLPMADFLYISHVDVVVRGDAFFPEFDQDLFKINYAEVCKEEKDEFSYT